jgi:excinuclease Cho
VPKPLTDPCASLHGTEHLRESLEGMPSSPGVYVFHGRDGDLPLYIGKSVNLRSRVLSHLRNPDESRMLRQATRISFIRTAGEIGALLLEAQMIKAQQPLYNQKLRRNRQLCSLQLPPEGPPQVVDSRHIDFATETGLFGLFPSRHAALEGLRSLADSHRLCLAVLGLEKPVAGRPCFGHMLRRCNGVCCGQESPQAHRARLLEALERLRVACWPHPGAVGLVERDTDPTPLQQIHVVRNWCYLGSVEQPQEAARLGRVAAAFDADGYKILCKPMLTSEVELIAL